MKNQSTGVPWGGLDDLCWIFEYLIAGPCRRPLSADFSNVKSVTAPWHRGYWEFLVINSHKGVKKYSPGGFFFVSEKFVCCPNYGRFSEFWSGGSADKVSIYGMKG